MGLPRDIQKNTPLPDRADALSSSMLTDWPEPVQTKC